MPEKNILNNMSEADIEKVIVDWLDNLLMRFCAKVVEDAQMNVSANGSVDSGYMKANIRFRKLAPLKYVIESTAPYSGFVEYGTSAHIIVPKYKKALAFEVGRKARLSGAKKGPAEIVIVKKVKHPGTAAKPFMEPAIHLNLQRLREGRL